MTLSPLRARLVASCCAVTFVAACASTPTPATDASPPDAPSLDVSTALDAPSPDVRAADASPADAPDATVVDVADSSARDASDVAIDAPATDALDAVVFDATAPDASDASAPDAPCDAAACRRVTIGAPLVMDALGNAGQTIAVGADGSYSLPYPLMANCADDDACTPVTGMVLNNHVQWPRPWPQPGGVRERAVGFVLGLTAASPPSPRDAGAGGFVVAGRPAGATDRGQVVVFFVDPASPGDPFNGDNEFGFVRHTGDEGLGQTLAFYQQYSSNTGPCQSNAPLVDLVARGFDPTRTGSCLQVRVQPSGDYAISQYSMTDGRCALTGATVTASTVVENCSTHGTCRPSSRPASCAYSTRNINFYTGEGTHSPASADPSSPSGTNGFLYGVAKKVAGAADVHAGTSLSGTFQLLRLL